MNAVEQDKFSDLVDLTQIKWQEWNLYQTKLDIMIEDVLINQFPSLDYEHFANAVLPFCKQNEAGEYMFQGKMIDREDFNNTVVHVVHVTWGVEPSDAEFNKFLKFMNDLFEYGKIWAFSNVGKPARPQKPQRPAQPQSPQKPMRPASPVRGI